MSNHKLNIIGFSGRKRSGKTTLARFLEFEENAKIITIANYLKFLCCELIGMTYEQLNINKDNGYTFDVVPDKQWYQIIDKHTKIGVDNIKNEIENKHIHSIRELLQIIGTDVIRKYNKNWHVEKMIEEIKSHSDKSLIVIDDVRFPNERQAIMDMNGVVYFIIRPNSLSISNHMSETALRWQDFNKEFVIINSYSNTNDLIREFKLHYQNNFETFIHKSLLLSENVEYLTCGDFGFCNIEENKDLINDILRQVQNDKRFVEYGLIHYKTCNKKLAEKYVLLVDKNNKNLEKHCNEFFTTNPLIVENLKIFC